jgi:hypothetical protein
MSCSPRVMGMLARRPAVSGSGLGGYPNLTGGERCRGQGRACKLTFLFRGGDLGVGEDVELEFAHALGFWVDLDGCHSTWVTEADLLSVGGGGQ